MSAALRAHEWELAERLSRSRGREVLVWGAGQAGRTAARVLDDHGVRCLGFIDRDSTKAGTLVDGRPVFAPDRLLAAGPRPRVVVASMYWREIASHLRSLGFRTRRDFDVFPDGGAVSSLTGSGASTYALWRHEWRAAAGLTPSVRGDAGVVVLSAPPAPGTNWLARVPADADAWVVVVDERAGRPRWNWRGGTAPADRDVARGAYDWAAPPLRDRRHPFLLRALAGAAALAGPVVCRARVLAAFVESHGRERPGLDALARWIAARVPASDRAEVDGLCEVAHLKPERLPRGALRRGAGRGHTRARRSSGRARVPGTEPLLAPSPPRAPVLVDFAAHAANADLPVFSPEEISTFLPGWAELYADSGSGMEYLQRPREARKAASSASRARRPSPGARGASRRPSLLVLAHSRGNFFFREIRDFLAHAWSRAGAHVTLGDESTPYVEDSRRVVVVAPHEFFVLEGRHRSWDDARHLTLVNTEQPQTRWFARCLGRLLTAARVFDLNWQTTLLLRTLGVDAHFLPLGWDDRWSHGRVRSALPAHKAFEGLSTADRSLPPTDRWADRPIDVLFVGTLSARRSEWFGRAAATLARYRCFLHLPPSARPITTGSCDSLDARDMADLCRRSKIVLNVHRDELPYCEWHRVMFQAMRQGALVVSEPMMPVPLFEPGRHYATTTLATLPGVLRRALETGAGRRHASAMAARASRVLRERFAANEIARRSLELS